MLKYSIYTRKSVLLEREKGINVNGYDESAFYTYLNRTFSVGTTTRE